MKHERRKLRFGLWYGIRLVDEYVAATGIERYYTWTIPPGFPVKRMNEHLELFAKKVTPHFR